MCSHLVPPSLAMGAAPTVAACTQFGYTYNIWPPKNAGLLIYPYKPRLRAPTWQAW